MIIRITLLIALIEFYLWNVAGTGYNCTPVTTELEKFNSHVLKRRTRAVLFPKNAAVLLTASFAKAVLDGRPRGLSYTMEFDMYHTLPDTIEAWKPTLLLNKIKQQDIQKKSDTINNAAAAAANATDKSILDNYTYSYDDAAEQPKYWPYDGFNDHDYYKFPLYEDETPNNWNYYHSQWDNDPKYFTRNLENPHIKKSFKLDSIAKQFHKRPYLDKRYQRNFNNQKNFNNHHDKRPQSKSRSSEIPYQNPRTLHDWTHNQRYRERRQIFDQLETVGKLFHFNMKACIRRAICEITTHLQPYGESLMEDIIRLILTIPSPPPSYDDDYNHSYDSINCEQHFALSCPYRVLDFLSHNIRSNMDQ